jgi:ribose 5-phosphate isomerase A
MTTADQRESQKRAAAEAAVEYVREGHIVGLGTGSTAKHAVLALAERVRGGLHIKGVPTSRETAELAKRHGISLLETPTEGQEKPKDARQAARYDAWVIDVTIDGADQVDPKLNLIKGGGGALLKEKIVAAASKQVIIIVDDSKRVPVLGGAVPLPIEVMPFGWGSTARQIERLGGKVQLRERDGRIFCTEAGHYLLDLYVDRIDDPLALEMHLNTIPGVVETGLFVNRTDVLIVGTPHGLEIQKAEQPKEAPRWAKG